MAESLIKLAALVSGQVLGDAQTPIEGAAPIRDAHPGDITLVDRVENVRQLIDCEASAVVVPADVPAPLSMPALVVDDVHRAFTAILLHFRSPRRHAPDGISPQAIVHPSARIGEGVIVHPGATIGAAAQVGPHSVIHSGVRIGDDCILGENVTIFPNVVLYENTVVGPRVVIHAGAVIGSYGFGYKFVEGRHEPTAQLGNVEIGPDVEIGACATIDRGTYGRTLIGAGTKIDNQVQIAHNCRIGRHNMLCSQVGIAGSTTTGDYVVMAGQVGVRDHVHIGSRSVLGAKAGVTNDVPDDVTYLGIPATPVREQRLLQAALSKLPEMRRQWRSLGRKIEQLTSEPQEAEQSDGGSPPARKDSAAA